MLRDHPVFQGPQPINLAAHSTIPTPDAWKFALTEPTIDVLPLAVDRTKTYAAGWCTYTYEHSQAPELEVICGGVNEKSPQAAAVWRQGNLLHFGFEQSPVELNDAGKRLLANSIVYIAGFSEDRPIVRTPGAGKRLLDRGAIDRLVKNQDRDLTEYLQWMMSPKEYNVLQGLNRDEVARWYVKHRGFVVADERGKFTIDREVEEFGVAADSEEFIPAAIAAWEMSEAASGLPRKLLGRFVPEGPGEGSTPAEWRAWHESNRTYLFYSDTGGFRWYVDPLAKKRGMPTSELRGPSRADERAATKVPTR